MNYCLKVHGSEVMVILPHMQLTSSALRGLQSHLPPPSSWLSEHEYREAYAVRNLWAQGDGALQPSCTATRIFKEDHPQCTRLSELSTSHSCTGGRLGGRSRVTPHANGRARI